MPEEKKEEKKSLFDVQNILTTIMLFALMYVFQSIGEGKHERDLMLKDIEHIKIDLAEVKLLAVEGLANVWIHNDNRDEQKKGEVAESFKFALDILDDVHRLEVELEKIKKK